MRIEMGWGNNRQIFGVDNKRQFKHIAGVKNVAGMGLNLSLPGKPKSGVEQKPDQYKSQIDCMREQFEAQRKGAAIRALEGKLMAGKMLTADELEYLREHAPDLYEKAMKVAREREAYRKELEKARSKEEVRKIQERHVQQFVNELKAIDKSDIGAMKFLMMRINGIMDEHNIFTQTDEYKRLPEKSDEPEEPKDAEEDTIKDDDEEPEIQDEDEESEDEDPIQYLKDMLGDFDIPVPEIETEIAELAPEPAKTEAKAALPGSVSGEAQTTAASVSASTPASPNVGTGSVDVMG